MSKGVCDGRCTQAEALRAEVERSTEQATTFRVECETLESRLAAATELLDRIEQHTLKHSFTTRDWFVSVFADRQRIANAPAAKETP